MIKNLSLVFLCLLSLVTFASCYSSQIRKENDPVADWKCHQSPLPMAQRKKIAVLLFEDQTDYGHGRIGRSAANVLTTYLDRSQQFSLYEREQLKQIFVEQGKTETDKIDAGTAAAVGKKAGVDLVVIGAVTGFGCKSRRNQVLCCGATVTNVAEATVDVRLVEVATGRIIVSESGTGMVETEATKVLGVGASAGYDETMAGNALRAAISKFVDKLIDQSLDQR